MFDSLAPASRPSGYPPAPFCEPESIRGWYRRTIIKRLSLRLPELNFPPYAEAHCTQQNAQSSGETLQDYCPWKGLEVAFLATPSMSTKSAKRKRRLGKAARVDDTDVARVKANLPFG